MQQGAGRQQRLQTSVVRLQPDQRPPCRKAYLRPDNDPNLGLRHRSALGLTELTDALAVVVSEQTGSISLVEDGNIHYNMAAAELRETHEKKLTDLQS